MECGFETIGNATAICYDNGPILVTDPWFEGGAYFGSWGHSHEVPEEQVEAIKESQFAWISHGHPDHLSGQSIEHLRGKTILLADHVGGKIASDLTGLGFTVTVLKDRTWTELSPRIKVFSIADYNQDSILLIDINGCLIVNLNDAGPRGWGGDVRKIVRQYPESFLLKLTGYGDADMINYFDERGERILPKAAMKIPVGPGLARAADGWGVRYVIPFSSIHRYQRADSVWANEYVTPLDAYQIGFESQRSELLPPFIRYDCQSHEYEEISPSELPDLALEPAIFGDDWSEKLIPGDLEKIRDYFTPISHLSEVADFIQLRVGGEDNHVELRPSSFKKGIIFEVPRGSLMQAVEYRIFDDLLIGNFMKTTLVGDWPKSGLHPDFNPYVPKYADNGLARSKRELDEYFREYRKRAPMAYLKHRFQHAAKSAVRRNIDTRNPLYERAKKGWWFFLGRHLE
jgi:hypothetical protein